MLTLNYQPTRITCTEANAPLYRGIIDSGKPRKFKKETDYSIKRDYPEFKPGMTTAEYVAAFNRMNGRISLRALEHGCPGMNNPAPMLDATFPEVTEELDPDYVAPAKAIKPKAATAAQLKAALAELIAAVEHGDPETIAQVAIRAKALI